MMARIYQALTLTAMVLGIHAQVSIPFDEYLTGLTDMLKMNGMNILSNAIGSVNVSETGGALLEALYRGDGFTLFGPVDASWAGIDLTDVTDDDLANIISYHITSTALNITNVAPPKKKTVAFSLLDDEETALPGDQTQVLVLETAPNTTEPVVYLRGPNWNATSISYTKRYENINVQAINRILQLPQNLMTTLNTPLADPAPQGTPQVSSLISKAGLNGTLEACRGCTFLVPIDDAFKGAEIWLDSLNDTSIEALIRNHIIEGQTVYSPSLDDGVNFITAAGTTLAAYASNSSGAYLFGEGGMAKFVRTDIIVTNGVIHLIDRVFNQTTVNQGPYEQAISSISQAAAEGEATLSGVLGTAVSLATPEPSISTTVTSTPAFGPSATPSPTNAAPSSMVVPGLKMGVLSFLFGVFWL